MIIDQFNGKNNAYSKISAVTNSTPAINPKASLTTNNIAVKKLIYVIFLIVIIIKQNAQPNKGCAFIY